MKLWLGKEREGRLIGIKTLFVGDSHITINDINEVAQYQNFKQIYFGAGGCSKINYGVVKSALLLFPKHIITLEIDYKEFNKVPVEIINSYANFILTVTNKGFSNFINMFRNRIQIKIQSLEGNKFLAIDTLSNFNIVDLSELRVKTYKGDKMLK